MQVEQGKFPVDPVLGFIDDMSVKMAVFERACRESDSILIEADYYNLQNLSAAIGRDEANKFMQLAAGIYKSEIKKLKPDAVSMFRHSAKDEISFFVKGVADGRFIQQAIDNSVALINTFVEEAGLAPLEHHKYKNLAGAGLYAAFKPLSADDNYQIVASHLQQDIVGQKRSLESRDHRVGPNFFHNGYVVEKFSAILNCEKWARFLQEDEEEIISPFVSFVQANSIRSIRKTRSERFNDIKNLPMIEKDFSFMRIDLMNMAGMNSLYGTAVTDIITAKLLQMAEDEIIAAYGNDAELYEVAGGVIDVIIPTQDKAEIAALKSKIHRRCYEEVLSKTAGEIIDGYKGASADMVLGEVPHQKNRYRHGMGLIMADAPINSTEYPAALFERIDSRVAILKMHNIAYVEELENNQLACYNLGQNTLFNVENKEFDTDNNVPYANSLRFLLQPEIIQELIQKPIGTVMQQLFGLDIAESLQRNYAILHLIGQGVEQQDIINSSRTMAEFDSWLSTEFPDFNGGRLTLLDRPNLHTRLDPRLMTLNLAQKWGVISNALKPLSSAALQGQLVARSFYRITRDGIPDSTQDSTGKLVSSIRTGFEGEWDIDLKRIQFVHETAEALGHVANLRERGSLPDVESRQALSALFEQSASATICKFEELGEREVAASFQAVAAHPSLPEQQNAENPFSVLHSKLVEAGQYIATLDLPAGQTQAIGRNIAGLQKVAESFEEYKFHPKPPSRSSHQPACRI